MTICRRFYIILFCAALLPYISSAQVQYEIRRDTQEGNAKILKGIINKSIIQNDTAFNWYQPSETIYYPDSSVVSVFKHANDSIQFVIFGGTWCEDTQFILPKFFKLLEMANINDDRVTLFGVDRNKKTLGHIAEAFHIINVPTIIIMKNGEELGRVVEYGKTGKWDHELAMIVKGEK